VTRPLPPRIGSVTLFALALGALSPALFAQQALDREIAFVRALAKDLRFIELARLEAEELAKANTAGGAQEKISQLAVEIAYYGARSRSDRTQQRTLFKETVQKSKELIETSQNPAVQLEARATLANASQDFGQFLIEELEIAREEAPDKVKELEEEATLVFRAGIDACSRVMDALKEQRATDEQKNTEFYLMWMKKAVLSREQGRADKANRGALVARAIGELEEMVLEVGEETAIGLRGLFEIAQCIEVDGKIPDAIGRYRDTVKQIATSLEQAEKGELDLPPELRAFLFEMLQEVYVRTGEVMVREGSPGTAELFEQFRKHMGQFGDKKSQLFDVVSDDHGHLMLLAEARFHAESGDPKKVGDALAMAQRINDRHPADYVGVRAKAVLRDILSLQRSLVSGSLLFEVAKGELQNKNYEEAIKGLRRALPAMTPEEQQKLGLQSYEMMGLAYAFSERYLEAMIAFREGLTRFAKTDEKKAEDVADAADRALSQHRRQVKNDPAWKGLHDEIAAAVATHSKGAGEKLFWKEANNAFNEGKYADAATSYGKLSPTFAFYEAARVNTARAQAMLGDFAAARKTLAEYRDFVGKTSLPASDTQKQQVRASALADAEYTEVQMAFAEARGDEQLKIAKDLTKYPTALEKAQGFLTNFAKDGESKLPVVLEYIGRLNSDLGKLDQAEAAYTQLKAKDPGRASRLATEIFKEYQERVKLLEGELDKLIAAGKEGPERNKAVSELDGARAKLIALGNDYIAGSPKPQLGILVATMQNAEAVRDWKRVDDVARKTLELYGSDETKGVKPVIDQLVRPMIGEALLQQKRFSEAYEMLLAAEKANPQQWELKRQIARALGGWFEINKVGTGVVEPGLDKPAEAFHKYYADKNNAYRVWGFDRPEVKKHSLEWYRFLWEAYWFAKRASLKDGKMKTTAETLYGIARSTDNFETLKSLGVKGDELYRFFQTNR
jgi:hypothetical protein